MTSREAALEILSTTPLAQNIISKCQKCQKLEDMPEMHSLYNLVKLRCKVFSYDSVDCANEMLNGDFEEAKSEFVKSFCTQFVTLAAEQPFVDAVGAVIGGAKHRGYSALY